MILNFKKKVMLLFIVSVVLSLGNVALAGCQIKGSQYFTLKLALRNNPAQASVPIVEIRCDTPTVMTARRNQPSEWNTFVNRISNNVRNASTGAPLPLENITSTFRVQLTQVGGNIVRTWHFDMARTNNILMQSNGDSYELQAGVDYRLSIDSLRGVISLPFNPAPYQYVGLSGYGAYLDLATAQPFRVQGDWSSSDVRPPEPSTCTASAFIVTAPSQVDFKQMDISSIQAGTMFTKPFTITITRRPNQNCKTTTTPSVTFTTANTVINQTHAVIPERGLLLSIYREKTKATLRFGTAYTWDAQSGLTPRVEKYEGRIMRDTSAKVTPGTFSATVNYSISYR